MDKLACSDDGSLKTKMEGKRKFEKREIARQGIIYILI